METWKMLLITLLAAVAIGVIGGILVGKHQLKKSRSSYNPILSFKERLIYLLCMALGAACVLFGIFYTFPSQNGDMDVIDDGMFMEGEMMGEGDMPEGGEFEEPITDDIDEPVGEAETVDEIIIGGGGGQAAVAEEVDIAVAVPARG